MDFASAVIGVIGTLIAVWIAVVGKQLRRPRLAVEVGFFNLLFEGPRRAFPWLQRPPRITAIAVGLTCAETKSIVLPLALHIENKGSIPITDVDVVFEFPVETLITKKGVVGPIRGQFAELEAAWPEGRETTKFQGVAQSRIPLGTLRPGETSVTGELLQLRTGFLAPALRSPERSEMLKRRYAACKQLRSVVEVRISVWSSSLGPISISVALLWFIAESQDDLRTALHQMVRASADAAPIEPGVYFSPPWSRMQRDELCELAILQAGKVDDLLIAISADGMMNNVLGAALLRLPPWGLWGDSFDVTTKWNRRLRKTAKPGEGNA